MHEFPFVLLIGRPLVADRRMVVGRRGGGVVRGSFGDCSARFRRVNSWEPPKCEAVLGGTSGCLTKCPVGLKALNPSFRILLCPSPRPPHRCILHFSNRSQPSPKEHFSGLTQQEQHIPLRSCLFGPWPTWLTCRFGTSPSPPLSDDQGCPPPSQMQSFLDTRF